MDNFLYPYMPRVIDDRPPTLYSILESIVNFGKPEDEQTRIRDLYKEGRKTIFDFSYPLTSHINKEDFEKMILNHFITRRIGFDTVELFRIKLDIKLNEIMPLYNKMFDSFENWDIFNDGEETIRSGADNTEGEITNNTTNNNTSDRKYAELPQGDLQAVQQGDYVTDYNYDTNNGTMSSTSNNINDRTYNETIKRTQADKMSLYKELQNNIQNIYKLIFDDLEDLFYKLV